MTFSTALVTVSISRVRQYPPAAFAILCHIVHIDFLPIHFLAHGELGVRRTDAVVLYQNGIHQRGGVIMVLALILQGAVESQQQAAVSVLTVRSVVNMCLYLLLREGSAPDGKIVDLSLLIVAISRGTSDDDRIIAH